MEIGQVAEYARQYADQEDPYDATMDRSGGSSTGVGTVDPTSVAGLSGESFGLLGGEAAAAACEADAKPAPLDYTLKDMDGNDVDLASFKGNVILLNFWATWCGPCKIEIPGFIELQDEYGSDGFVVIGLSTDDTPDQIKPFAEEFAVNYPMLVGLNETEFQEAWGPIWGLPMSFWIDRDGTWCKTHMGIGTKDQFESES